MLIGLDFDNTIVCYDKAIARLADEFFDLPHDLPRTKLALRDFLRETNREAEWTAFQGEVYGPGLKYAEPFEDSIASMKKLKSLSYRLCIVSHRTKWPYKGFLYDLHSHAQEWIERVLLPENIFEDRSIFFFETKQEKIEAIKQLNCSMFLDDMPEILENSSFPPATRGILFKPSDERYGFDDRNIDQSVCRHWADFPSLINVLSNKIKKSK